MNREGEINQIKIQASNMHIYYIHYPNIIMKACIWFINKIINQLLCM